MMCKNIQSHAISDKKFTLTIIQVILLSFLLGVGFLLIFATAKSFILNTVVLFVCIIFAGLWLSNQTAIILCDQKLNILGTLWLIKVFATLFLLYAGWVPELTPSASNVWGYDPQRYFLYSWDLVMQGWDPSGFNQNYPGILYYYAFLFAIFGHNPVIPALFNAFVTLIGTVCIIYCLYKFMPNKTNVDWRIVFLLLIPEVLWYDVMTSRETLMAVLIVIAALSPLYHIIDESRAQLIKTLALFGIASILILAVRSSMMIPVSVSILVVSILIRSNRTMGPFIKIILILLGIAALMAGPIVQKFLGGYDVDYVKTIGRLQSFKGSAIAQLEWSEQSIGMLLVPDGLLQSIAFLPARMVLYLTAPLPNITVSISDLISGSWRSWQRLMTIPTSALMLLFFPYVLSGSAFSWSLRKTYPAMLIIPVVFWINFAAVAGGNVIIHERYRLMITMLLFSCAWIGYTRCSSRQVRYYAVPWFGLLGISAFSYTIYKFI